MPHRKRIEPQKQLLALENRMKRDLALPLRAFRKEQGYKTVFGEGAANATILFVGEAPGEQEALTGRPFIGRAGKKLSEVLKKAGIQRDQVYITSVVKDRPPKNRYPTKQETELYGAYLIKQIDIIRPDFVVPLGRCAMNFLFKTYAPGSTILLKEKHGKALPVHNQPFQLFVTYHPAAVFYNRSLQPILEKDIKVLQKLQKSAK